MNFTYDRLSASDGTWAKFLTDWEAQCAEYTEDFAYYLTGPIATVRDLAEGAAQKDASVFGMHDGSRYCAMFQVNTALLPGYTGRVLRVRMLYLSPHYDLGDTAVDDYSTILVDLFSQIVVLSNTTMQALHIKFHLRSPADRQFFALLGGSLGSAGVFTKVDHRGAWLYITK
jgi:hypothetical protein